MTEQDTEKPMNVYGHPAFTPAGDDIAQLVQGLHQVREMLR